MRDEFDRKSEIGGFLFPLSNKFFAKMTELEIEPGNDGRTDRYFLGRLAAICECVCFPGFIH